MTSSELIEQARTERETYGAELERIRSDDSLGAGDRRRRIAALWSNKRSKLEELRRQYVDQRDTEIEELEAKAFAPPQGTSVAAVRGALRELTGGNASERRVFHREAVNAGDRAALAALGRIAHRHGEHDLAATALQAISPEHTAAYTQLRARGREGPVAQLAASMAFSLPERPEAVRAVGDGGADLIAQQETKR